MGVTFAMVVGIGLAGLLLARKVFGQSASVTAVLNSLAVKLSKAQMINAAIIAEECANAGLPDRIAAAAIVNAWAESGLDANVLGDSGHSVGLFQLHDKGGGHGLTVEYRRDPRNNVKTILQREVLKPRGNVLRQRAAEGAGVGELAAIFSRDIERPKDKQGNMDKRKTMAEKWFPTMA